MSKKRNIYDCHRTFFPQRPEKIATQTDGKFHEIPEDKPSA